MQRPDKKKINICTVIIGRTLDSFLKNLAETQKISGFVELRVDYIRNLNMEDLKVLRENTFRHNIFTYRKTKEGGKSDIAERQRVEFIKKAIELGFEHVDIELSTLRNFFFKRKKGTKIIASFHEFRTTPSFKHLAGIMEEMRGFGADVKKIVTFVNSEKDNMKLFRILLNRKPQEELIALGMGRQGQITRILSPLLGGYLTFASTRKSKTAPGQIDLKELESLYKKMGLTHFK